VWSCGRVLEQTGACQSESRGCVVADVVNASDLHPADDSMWIVHDVGLHAVLHMLLMHLSDGLGAGVSCHAAWMYTIV
jgi:hypothetical protein